MTYVQGACPMGCGEGLILGEGGVLWCGSLFCPKPDAAAQIISDTEAGHIVVLGETSFTVRHPLRERLDDGLMTCALHARIAGQDTAPAPPGRYRVTGDPGGTLHWERQG